jgi:hypothetical protein
MSVSSPSVNASISRRTVELIKQGFMPNVASARAQREHGIDAPSPFVAMLADTGDDIARDLVSRGAGSPAPELDEHSGR